VERYFRRFRSALAWPLRRIFKGRPITYVLSGRQSRYFVVDLYLGSVHEAATLEDDVHRLQIHTSSFIFRQCMALNLFLYLGISKRVVFRCRKSEAKYLWILEFLFNLYECDMLPLRRMLKPRFILAWFPRWREILLYGRILARKAAGKPFSLSDYLAPGPGRPASMPTIPVS
jgi:UDP-MurNAc hydroxylase